MEDLEDLKTITMDRVLFRWLVLRWLRLEIEDRGLRAVLAQAMKQNPAGAKDFAALLQMETNRLPPAWIELESELQDALAIKDDPASLSVLSLFASLLESRRESGDPPLS